MEEAESTEMIKSMYLDLRDKSVTKRNNAMQIFRLHPRNKMGNSTEDPRCHSETVAPFS